MIIVEGMDNSGKTTLVEALKERLQWPVAPSTGGPDRLRERQDRLYRTIEPTIFDRLPVLSEEVYGRILRGKSFFDGRVGLEIALTLRCKPLIVYCRPRDSDVFHFGNRKQMDGVIENAHRLLAGYDQLMINTLSSVWGFHGVYIYDWREADALEVLLKVVQEFLSWEIQLCHLAIQKEMSDASRTARSTEGNLQPSTQSDDQVRSGRKG